MSSSLLNDLIQRYRVADEALCKQIDFTDSHIAAGTITDEIWQLQFDVGSVGEAIVLEICGYRPSSPSEADQKSRFLMEWTKDTQLEPDEAKALLGSMLLPQVQS